MRNTTPPRRVDFVNTITDEQVALLGMLGLTTDSISHYTGLTSNQVNYRLRLVSIKRTQYRRSESRLSKTLVSQVISTNKSFTHDAAHDELAAILRATGYANRGLKEAAHLARHMRLVG